MSHFDDIEDYYFEKYYIDQKRRMKTMYQNIATKVLTGEVRLSYANLTAPRAAQDGGEPKYSVTLLIPKTDTATKADIDASMKAAYEDGVSKKWGGARPQPKVILHDGDGLRPSGLPFGDECKGCWVLTASSKNKPQVVGIDNIQCSTSVYLSLRLALKLFRGEPAISEFDWNFSAIHTSSPRFSTHVCSVLQNLLRFLQPGHG